MNLELRERVERALAGERFGDVYRELLDEIDRLRQGLWDCAGVAGEDLDGDETPKHLAHPDIVEFALQAVRQLRDDYAEALKELP